MSYLRKPLKPLIRGRMEATTALWNHLIKDALCPNCAAQEPPHNSDCLWCAYKEMTRKTVEKWSNYSDQPEEEKESPMLEWETALLHKHFHVT